MAAVKTLTGVLLADEALLDGGGAFVRRGSQTQHLPLAGAALAHQEGLGAPASATETRYRNAGMLKILFLFTDYSGGGHRWCKWQCDVRNNSEMYPLNIGLQGAAGASGELSKK